MSVSGLAFCRSGIEGLQGCVNTTSHQCALQRQNSKISKKIFPEKEYQGLSTNFHIHASVSDLYIYSYHRSAYSAGGNMKTDPGTI